MKRLDEIEARANSATEGPWTWATHSTADGDEWAVFSPADWALATNRDGWGADAEFIAHSRRDIPDMLGFIRDLITLIEDKESSFSRKIATDLEGNPFPALVSADEIRRLLNRHLGGYIES